MKIVATPGRIAAAVVVAAQITAMPALADQAADPLAQDAKPAAKAADKAAAGKAATKVANKDDNAATELGPVIVTAQKRAQNLQDVPIAVTALTQQQLESRGVQNLLDLNALGPGLQVSKTPSDSTISQISIRGVTEINPAIYWDPAVGVYLDGVYIGKAQGSVFDVVDLSRIEVLRGPQGTLYGRNTLAGAINMVTAKPTGQFDGQASLDYGNYNQLTQKLSLDLPKWGIASVSLGARSEQRDGWVTGAAGSSASELNNRKNDGLRLAVNLAFMPGLQADYRFDHSDVDQAPSFAQLYRADAAYFTYLGYPTLGNYVSQDRQTVADINSPVFEKSRVTGHSLTVTWDIDEHNTFKSISAYRHLDWSDSLDLDGSPNDVAFTQRFTKYHEVSQELQLVGHASRWNYVGGLYYFSDDGRTDNPQHFFSNGVDYDSEYGTHTNAGSAYGQVDYKLFDPLTLTAGIRYTEESKKLDRVFGCNSYFYASCTTTPGSYVYLIPAGTHGERTFEATTPVVSIAYKFNDNLNSYIRYAYGFKSGGFNGEYSDPTASSQANIDETLTPFKPEKQKSLELGVKSEFLHKRAQLSAAVFQNKAKDLQESVFVGAGAASTVVRNAGAATIRGIELEGAFVPMAGTTLHLNYTYLDPKYDEFIDGGQNVKDNRAFPHAPRNAFNAVIDTRLARFDWGSVRAVADYAYTSSIYTYPYQLVSPVNPPTQQVASNSEVKGYGLLNLRLALVQVPLGQSAEGELALWGRNVTDEKVAANFIDFGPGFGNLESAYFIDPRTYGITGTVRW